MFRNVPRTNKFDLTIHTSSSFLKLSSFLNGQPEIVHFWNKFVKLRWSAWNSSFLNASSTGNYIAFTTSIVAYGIGHLHIWKARKLKATRITKKTPSTVDYTLTQPAVPLPWSIMSLCSRFTSLLILHTVHCTLKYMDERKRTR